MKQCYSSAGIAIEWLPCCYGYILDWSNYYKAASEWLIFEKQMNRIFKQMFGRWFYFLKTDESHFLINVRSLLFIHSNSFFQFPKFQVLQSVNCRAFWIFNLYNFWMKLVRFRNNRWFFRNFGALGVETWTFVQFLPFCSKTTPSVQFYVF